MTTLGVDFADFSGVLPFSKSWLGVRLGGRGGSFEASNTGAILLPPSIDGVREADVLAVPLESVPFERADMAEILEVVEAIDSFESRRFSEGRLGGKAGDGCVEFFRGGSLGGGVGFANVDIRISVFFDSENLWSGGFRKGPTWLYNFLASSSNTWRRQDALSSCANRLVANCIARKRTDRSCRRIASLLKLRPVCHVALPSGSCDWGSPHMS